MGYMLDSDWSKKILLRSDWLLPSVAWFTTNVSFNKWLGILAGEDLPSKLHCSENGDLKSSASNEEYELV